ncbi:MAG: hypothetical protein DI620_03160 [Haemophilus parainfluenzae]|nr:MAG: hypothetical protein DI620_03160 [Haemophilus parainfluenzae]
MPGLIGLKIAQKKDLRMTKDTLSSFAKQLKLPEDEVIKQFRSIGVELSSSDDEITADHKKAFALALLVKKPKKVLWLGCK